MYKIIKDNKIAGVVEKWTDGDKLCNPSLIAIEDTEHQISDYVMVGDEFILDTDAKAIEKQKENVRQVRNSYLEEYVDPKQLVLVWETLSEEDKETYKTYRQYLLDYPESSETWFEEKPKTFEEWSE